MELVGRALTTAPRPPSTPQFVTAFLDRLLLLSPRTWFGVLQLQSTYPESPLQASVLRDSTIGAVLPTVTIFLLMKLAAEKQDTRLLLRRLALPYLVSPWILQSIYQVLLQCLYLVKTMYRSFGDRSPVFPSATHELETRISRNRAYRTRRYDVYLPPSREGGNIQRAVVLFPGAFVPHGAYSEVAGRLSDAGLVVVAVSMEPLLLAHPHLGADLGSMRRIMKKTQQQLELAEVEWSLMGHSMGAFAAMRLFDQLRSHGDCTVRRLALWGVAAFVAASTDLSKYEDDDILLVQASNDFVVEMMSENQEELDAQFPETAQQKMIQGGTHHGFASYSSSFSHQDGERKELSYREQQQQACALTARFLLR